MLGKKPRVLAPRSQCFPGCAAGSLDFTPDSANLSEIWCLALQTELVIDRSMQSITELTFPVL